MNIQKVVIVYSLVNSSWITHKLIKKIQDSGKEAVLVDNTNVQTTEDYLRRIHSAVGSDIVDLIGICQGGHYALLYASKHPDSVRKIHLMSTPVRGMEPMNLMVDMHKLWLKIHFNPSKFWKMADETDFDRWLDSYQTIKKAVWNDWAESTRDGLLGRIIAKNRRKIRSYVGMLDDVVTPDQQYTHKAYIYQKGGHIAPFYSSEYMKDLIKEIGE
jgi:pimeloyl-ACP methyl ester carboxylesterase